MNYVSFAAAFAVSPSDAYVIPALFENAAAKVGMSVSGLLAEVALNRKLGEYLAQAARKAADADRREAA